MKKAQLNAPMPAGVRVERTRHWHNRLFADVQRLIAASELDREGRRGQVGSAARVIAWARVTGEDEGAILADIFRGEDAREVVLAEGVEIKLIGVPESYEPTEGDLFIVMRHKGYWEGVFIEAAGAGLPEIPEEGVVVLGVQGEERDPEWFDTIIIDYAEE